MNNMWCDFRWPSLNNDLMSQHIFIFSHDEYNVALYKTKFGTTAETLSAAYPSKETSGCRSDCLTGNHIDFAPSLTCVHLIHTVKEVIWSAGNTVAAHTQAAVCALIPGVVGPAETYEDIWVINSAQSAINILISVRLKGIKSFFCKQSLRMSLMTFT